MDLQLKTQYWDDPSALAAFKTFILKIHGLNFTDWDSGGFWDHSYTPFSFFDGDKVVASVCVYLLDAVVNGEDTCLAQVSGVGTLPEWRRRGLNRQLTDVALDWARGKHDGVFLFANTEAVPFYNKCGFSSIDEFVETIDVTPVPKCGGSVRLDPGNDQELNRIYEYATQRAPVSDQFSVLNAKLLMFHVLYILRDCIYEISNLDCLVFCRRANGTLSIYDIVGERIPRLEELYPYVAAASDRVIEFHFNTDKLGLEKVGTRPLIGNNPFIKGAFPIEKPVFPFTSRA
jgi:GNAT superfamily N-acetyltransferase